MASPENRKGNKSDKQAPYGDSTPGGLAGSERPRPDSHKFIGPSDPNKWIGVTVVVRPRPGSKPLPTLEDWAATPLRQRKALSREEYAQLHGADPADLEAVARFAAEHGLKITSSHAGRRAVVLEGRPAQFNAAFGIVLNHYEAPVPQAVCRSKSGSGAPKEAPRIHIHHGYDGAVRLPESLKDIVYAVVGLDDRLRGVRAGSPVPAGSGDDPSGAAFFTVPAIAQRYNFPTSGAADKTIGVFAPTSGGSTFVSGDAAYLSKDILNSYFPSLPSGYTKAPTLNDIALTVSGTVHQNNTGQVNTLQSSNSSKASTYVFSGFNGGILEVTQDISTSTSIAQGANVNVYFTANTEQGWITFLDRVLQPQGEKGPSVVTVSWIFALGDDANGTSNYTGIGALTSNPLTSSSSTVDWFTRKLQALASVGVDVFIAQGDWGADNWYPLGNNPPVAPDGKSHVMYPATDPWVTSCGGTVVGTSDEYVWGDPYTTSGFGSSTSNRAATGGGVSATFPAPVYQTTAGINGATPVGGSLISGRGVPDIAGMVGLEWFFANGIQYNFIGTSCVAPLYAGLAAAVKSAVGRDLGPFNDTLYALKDVAFNDIKTGNNSSNDTPANVAIAFSQFSVPPYKGTTANAPYFAAQAGWDACTGLGSVDGTKLLNGIASLLFNPNFYFQVNKGSFGLAEVNITKTYTSPTPFWLVLEGFTPNAVSAAGIKPTIVPSVGGITVTVGAAQPEIATALDTPQRIYFPCSVSFAASAVKTIADGGIFPPPGSPPTPTQVLLLAPSITIADQILPAAETTLMLDPGADPYFANFATNGYFYLSQDLRVFTVTPGVNSAPIDSIALGAPDNTTWNAGGGYAYIQNLLKHLNSTYSNPSGTDPFTLFPDQNNAVSGDSSVTPTSINPTNPTGTPFANYNFAVARVRLDGAANSSSVANVRVLFRMFASQTGDTDFQPTTYPSTNDSEGQPLAPELGVGNVTIPFFATGNYQGNSDFTANTDYSGNSINNQPISIGASGQVWAYYGCYLNIFPTGNTINGSAVQALLPSSHSCLVAQLVYDDAPNPTNTNVVLGPEYTDTFAQRNLQITFSDNPGPAESHLVPQTFDARPSPAPGTGPLQNYPDEFMISWGDTPVGSTASIYWPGVAAADVLALATEFYSTHQLSASDANTIQCTVPRGVTCVPIPVGTGDNLAGLFTVQLPQGVKAGQTYTITVRRVSTFTAVENQAPPPPPPIKIAGTARPGIQNAPAEAARRLRNWRYITGSFAVQIPVTTPKVMEPMEKNTLAIMKWRLLQQPAGNRWIPVLKRYISYLEGRLKGIGGDPGTIKPSPWGWFGPPPSEKGGHGGRGGHGGSGGQTCDEREEVAGKVNGLVYDRFGDFEGFRLRTEHGYERIYYTREAEVESLVRSAWRERMVIAVVTKRHEPDLPVEIILLRAPPQPIRPEP
ncbi:MAG TPA: S53 family serine peptidase [Opitutaceae bacterium]